MIVLGSSTRVPATVRPTGNGENSCEEEEEEEKRESDIMRRPCLVCEINVEEELLAAVASENVMQSSSTGTVVISSVVGLAGTGVAASDPISPMIDDD